MPQKQGLAALKNIYKKNPDYFDQFVQDADRRAVEVLGPLFGIDTDTWKRFREESLGSRADAQQALERLHKQLSDLLAETSHLIKKPIDLHVQSVTTRLKRRGAKPRLTTQEKQRRQQAKKLRLQAHKLVIKVARKRDASPALVYAELTKKYGHKAKEADVSELKTRIHFLNSKLS